MDYFSSILIWQDHHYSSYSSQVPRLCGLDKKDFGLDTQALEITELLLLLAYLFYFPEDYEVALKTDSGPTMKNLKSKELHAVFNELNSQSVCSFQHLMYHYPSFFLMFFWWGFFFFFSVLFFKKPLKPEPWSIYYYFSGDLCCSIMTFHFNLTLPTPCINPPK